MTSESLDSAMSSEAASETAPGMSMGDARVERLELGVLGDVERIVRERRILLLHESSPGYDSVSSLARSSGVSLRLGVRLTVGPVDVVGDREPGHGHRAR